MISRVLLILFCSVFFSFAQERRGYLVGDRAADFKLQNVDGQYLSLSDMKSAKGFIVLFICNHCPCVAKYEDRIMALDKKYKPLGYPVVAINSLDVVQYPQESLVRMKSRAKFKNYEFPYLSDAEQSVVKTYGAPTTPYVYILQKSNNQLVVRYTGGIDDCMERATAVKEKYVENAVNQLLEGKQVDKSSAATLGCTISIRKK
jgi:peroxiredoxin